MRRLRRRWPRGRVSKAEAIVEALRSFRSVKRRLEVRAEVGGITIIDDFAHHPTAIRETLRALREAYTGRRIWAVLEPRSNTLRRNVFELPLVESLSLADRVVLSAVFKSESIPIAERLKTENVVARLIAAGVPAVTVNDADAVVAELVPQLSERGRRGDSFEWRLWRYLREAAQCAGCCTHRDERALRPSECLPPSRL